MENASKALLMAAGVLMGILVLSLIVYIYATFSDSTQKSMEQIKLNETVAFNSKYLAYDGREDLTCYDILNIANMAIKDNEDDEHPKVAVLIMNATVNPGESYLDMRTASIKYNLTTVPPVLRLQQVCKGN